MDPALRELLRSGLDPGDEVEAIIRLHDPRVGVPGVRIVSRFGSIATCRLRAGSVRAVRANANVASLKDSRPLLPESEPPVDADQGDPTADVVGTDLRRPDSLDANGAGVVLGVVDWGCDFDHPNFKAPDGSTRLRALWDQRGPDHSGTADPYGYGTVHRRAEIDLALRSARPYQTLGYHPADADPQDVGAHGTHVLDLAAGNGRAGGPVGLAPEADLVFVHLSDRGTSGLANLGDSGRILEAVDFVARTAAGGPWVVNLSVGRCGGPHDGCTLTELALDALVRTTRGGFVVQSAGNYYDKATHASGRLEPGQTRELTVVTDVADVTPNELEIWYAGQDEFVVRVESPTGQQSSWVRLGGLAEVGDGNRSVGRIYHRAGDPNNDDNQIEVFLDPSAPAGRWTVTLWGLRCGDGIYHAWLERDEVCGACQARFAEPDVDGSTTTGTIANGRLPLVVGAYDAHRSPRAMARFSSAGPTRDGRTKPDLVAPGVQVIAARSAPRGSATSPGLLVRKSGTSMAAPQVAGAVALCLGAGVALGAGEIRALLIDSTEPIRAGSNDPRSGRGCLDVRGLVAAVSSFQHQNQLKELTMQSDRMPRTPSIAPARLYREIAYCREDRLPPRIDANYVVVARPGELPSTTPEAGDLLVRVALGEPVPGQLVAPPDPTLVLDRSGRMPFGQLLLRVRTTGDHAELRTEHDFDEDDGRAEHDDAEFWFWPPWHVIVARGVWATLFPRSAALAKVRILDLATAPSKAIAGSGFSAWTNSPTAIYVAANENADNAYWMAVLYHESLHIDQFNDPAGGRPASYAAMMRYECDAYTESARWAAAHKDAGVQAFAEQMRATAKQFCTEIAAAEKKESDAERREVRYRKFLLTHNLPEHKRLRDLYAPTAAALRNPDAVESTGAVLPRQHRSLPQPLASDDHPVGSESNGSLTCQEARALAAGHDPASNRLVELLEQPIARNEYAKIDARVRDLTALVGSLDPGQKVVLRRRLDDPADPLGRLFLCELDRRLRRRLRKLLDGPAPLAPATSAPRPAPTEPTCEAGSPSPTRRDISSVTRLFPWERALLALINDTDEADFDGVNILIGPVILPGLMTNVHRIIVETALRGDNAITIGNNVWFPQPIDTSRNLRCLLWLVHESRHVADYSIAGTEAFLQTYVATAVAAGFDHDEIPAERRANRFELAAERLFGRFPRLAETIRSGDGPAILADLTSRREVYQAALREVMPAEEAEPESVPADQVGQDVAEAQPQVGTRALPPRTCCCWPRSRCPELPTCWTRQPWASTGGQKNSA